MKKVIFSAIAMIAFVGSSMANDIAEVPVKVLNKIQSTVKSKAEIDCDKVAKDVWWSWWGNGFSAETADQKKAQAKKDCEDEKKKVTREQPKGMSQG